LAATCAYISLPIPYYIYPDIIVICEEPVFTDDEFDTIINPSILFEILSPSTENYDRGVKFDQYREISLAEIYDGFDKVKR
jgi:Uma2 family endonuclease